MNKWIWVLIVVVIALGLYFLLSGDGGSAGNVGSGVAGNIPSPPALPN